MQRIYSLLLLLLLLPGISQAEVKATIKGPKEVLAGTLLFLSSEDAVGVNKVWMIPEELRSTSASCGENIFFAIPKAGDYRFGLVVADKEANIDYTFVTIKVYNLPPTTPDPVVTPPPTTPTPIPVPAPTFIELRKASTTGSSFLADADTATKLNQGLTAVGNSAATKTIQELETDATRVIENVFATRTGISRSKDWITQWRIPVNNELRKLNITDPKVYGQALIAIAGSICINGQCPLPQ